ncbi:formimidoylglutamate deiminase [Gemmobacter nanjingensis]|uniref:Formimidoylglutamate deiminase n=1 Tax=Gemmobacter nanjingensis TaxID=488454 RepID=A0ABQ3F6Z8_9RHOB|nr:formimidoylglutamate deiminase [Gemmobacter nanjingensis]GHC10335.1 formimidoylglutamate deiminase [Gemmobacter nanjingensis]
MTVIWAETALLPNGWAEAVRVEMAEGRITSVTPGTAPEGQRVGCLLPAGQNLHSHAFQRAMAGMTERRGAGQDSFWTWRTLMYRFLDHLTPEDVQAIAALVQVEMLEAGFAGVSEFHYLHHQPGGAPYADLAEMSARIVAAAAETGIGLTLLPVAYERGGCDGRALTTGQLRFGNAPDRFARLHEAAAKAVATLPDGVIGVAPHSLRAVRPETLAAMPGFGGPVHLHLAEQVAEVEEVQAAYGARPTEWLLAHAPVDTRWCLIHATQMLPAETEALARTGAVAGLCPITEANLGDGIFDGMRWQAAGGVFGVGSDSNIRISQAEELRSYEYSQRLRDRGRAMLATADASNGRVLVESAARGGAQAGGRAAGAIGPGLWADLLALDTGALMLEGRREDAILDVWIFAGDDRLVADLWSAGRHVVRGGRHVARDSIETRYRAVMRRLVGVM